jgi:hypothetical protein
MEGRALLSLGPSLTLIVVRLPQLALTILAEIPTTPFLARLWGS